MGHQQLPAVKGQGGLHSRHRNLHWPGQGLPLAPHQISRQCCTPSHGELAGRQQQPHAVHGPFLQLCRALLPADEQTGSPGSRHCHAKPQELHLGIRQAADQIWPVKFWCRGGLCAIAWKDHIQAHPLPEQLP